MFYGRENANYIHANRYPVAAAQSIPQHKPPSSSWGCGAWWGVLREGPLSALLFGQMRVRAKYRRKTKHWI